MQEVGQRVDDGHRAAAGELLEQAGLPKGVFNIVHGGRDSVDALLTHPQVRAVLDAPLQMARENDLLRASAGRPGDTDLEPLLQAAATAQHGRPLPEVVDDLLVRFGLVTVEQLTEWRSYVILGNAVVAAVITR